MNQVSRNLPEINVMGFFTLNKRLFPTVTNKKIQFFSVSIIDCLNIGL